MGQREEREGAASLLTEREAVIKWRHSQRFAFGRGGCRRVGACIRQENHRWLRCLYVTQRTASPASATPEPRSRLGLAPAPELSTTFVPLLSLSSSSSPSGLSLIKQALLEPEQHLLNHFMFPFSSCILTQYKEMRLQRNTFFL